jgi:hypothetical protein
VPSHIGAFGVATLSAVAALALGGCGGEDEPEEGSEPTTKPSKPATGEGTATSPSGQTSRLAVVVEPARAGTEAQPRGVTLEVTFRFGTTSGASPSPPTAVVVRLNRGFTANGKAFPVCRTADLEAGGPERCRKAKLATGSSEVIGDNGDRVNVKLTGFHAGTRRGRTEYQFFGEAPGLDPIIAVAGVERLPSGPYGVSLEIPPPVAGGSHPVTRVTYKTLDLTTTRTVGGEQVETHFLEAPTSCEGSWRFEARVTFKSGETLTSRVSVPCSS